MNLNEYQTLSQRTMPNKGFEEDLSNYSMGLSGESGEVIDILKKIVHHGHPYTVEMKEKLHEELGDVMHYVAGLCTLLGFQMDLVGQANIKKLKKRYPVGFSAADSVKRVDVK